MDYSTNIPKPVNGGEGTSSQPISPSSPSSSSLAVPRQAVRTEMVNAARQFLANPRVRLTPVHEQRDFLKGKGLTEEEIEAAMADIAEKRLVNGQRQQARKFTAKANYSCPIACPTPPIFFFAYSVQTNTALSSRT